METAGFTKSLSPFSFLWLSPPSVAILSWISIARLSYMPPNDVTQERKSGVSAQLLFLPRDCMKLLPKMQFWLHRLLLGRGLVGCSISIWAKSFLNLCIWDGLPCDWVGVAVYSISNAPAHTDSGCMMCSPTSQSACGFLKNYLEAEHNLGSILAIHTSHQHIPKATPNSAPLPYTPRVRPYSPGEMPADWSLTQH